MRWWTRCASVADRQASRPAGNEAYEMPKTERKGGGKQPWRCEGGAPTKRL
jgi:hypothetical protein